MNTDTISSTRPIRLRLFGAFRQFSEAAEIRLEVAIDATVGDLRQAVERQLADNGNALALLHASAFATDEAVLDEADTLPADGRLAILPPVCGG